MAEPMRSSELEKAVQEVTNVPEPDVEFIRSLRAHFIAEGHASAIKHQETQMKQRSLKKRLAWVAVAFVVVALAVLATNPTVVNALKRLFGYVPNVGIIDQSSQVMVLSKPVTVSREGFTVTLEQAVSNDQKITIVYSYSVPAGFSFIPDPQGMYGEEPSLTLPDGTRLDVLAGRRVSTADCPNCSMRYALDFAPVPNSLDSARLELPTLVAMQLGAAPEHWSIPLQLRPAGPDDIAPVIEYEVTPLPTSTQPVSETPTASVNTHGITNTLDKFAALPDGYVLYGSTSWTDPAILPYGVGATLANIKDANGMDVPFEYDDPGMYPAQGELRMYWAYKIGLDFTAPLTLNFVMTASLPVDGGSFTFDPGPDPQPGQKWEINQDVIVNGQVVHVLSAEQAGVEPGYFQFRMKPDGNIVGASIIDLAHPPEGFGGGGGGVPQEKAEFAAGFQYQMPLPQGPLTLTFTNVQIVVPGDWTLRWNP